MDLILAFCYAGTMWFVQLCLLWDIHFLVGKKADYLLFMTIRGEQREDGDVKQVVREFKKEFWVMMAILFAATGGFFLLLFLPVGVGAMQILYMTLWLVALILADYKVIKKYANRMYELKISKGWGNPPKQSSMEVDTVVSRMKKSLPVSEIWLAIPAWICIGSFIWWFYCASEYKMLFITLGTNVAAFIFFCYMYHRMAHGKLKVYSEDSELNYALNRASRRAWTGCVVWEAVLICGYHFIATLLIHSYIKDVAAGVENMTRFWGWFAVGTVGSLALIFLVFFRAANRVKQAKKELAAAANFSYVEDEDAYWRNGYYYNPQDTNTFVENRAFGLTTNMATKWGPITKWVLIGTLVFCVGLAVALLPFNFGKITMKATEGGIELKGCLYYKEHISFEDVEEVLLLTEKPESSRVWGTGTERFSLGDYRFKDYGNGTAMMDKEAEYFILVKRMNGKWFGFSVKDSEEMLAVYDRLKECSGGNERPEKPTATPVPTVLPEPTATPAPTIPPELKTTPVPTETIPERGIYVSEDGALYVEGEAYSITFEDEFEGTELDTTKWERCPEWKRQDLNCYWDNNCSAVNGDGKLTITSEYRNGNYYMGAIRSKGKFTQTYGYYEVRCTLNTIPGYWTAFWLMGETVGNENGSGVDGTEIDIMESAYFGQAINHALHWDGYGANHASIGKRTFNSDVYDGDYHTFSLLWTETEYIFYIDGVETWRTSAKEAGGVCQAPLYLKFTSETGSWTASALDTSKFPTSVYVDYVKVYERKK